MSRGEVERLASSSFEKMLLSPWFSVYSGVLGTTLTVVGLVMQMGVVAISILVVFGFISLGSILARQYARRVRNRAEQTITRIHATFESLHLYIHNARDHAVAFLDAQERLLDAEEQRASVEPSTFVVEIHRHIEQLLRDLAEDMLRIFHPLLPPDSAPWIAIREIRKSKHGPSEYHTLIRVGPVNGDRKASSEPIKEDQGLPRYLRQQHSLGKGIVILGQERGADRWRATPNDTRDEDKCVMAGPVFLKCITPPEMTMILYVNSPKKEVFDERHVPLMKCCTDVLSMFFNMISDTVLEIHEPVDHHS